MDITIRLPHKTVVLALTYDLKAALLEANEEAGERAHREGRREDAIQALTQNLQLFHQGKPLFGEGLQYLATLVRLRELGTQTQVRPRRRWWHKLVEKMWRPPMQLGPTMELNSERWEALLGKLLSLQGRACVQGDEARSNEIASLFRRFESAGLWQQCGA